MDKPRSTINRLCAGKFLVKDGHVFDCESFDFEKLNQQPLVYEVIRVIDSVPLFVENHLERFHQSLQMAGVTASISDIEMVATIRMLIEVNLTEIGNVKLIYPTKPLAQNLGLTAFFIPHKYPEPSMYENGVEVVTMMKSRSNPNAKISNPDLRQLADHLIDSQNVFEVLLVDAVAGVTECSRSNIFFTDNEKVVTAPGSIVLKGITRDYIFRLCEKHQITLQERKIQRVELSAFSSAFITGTSPKVLPVRRIDDHRYALNNSLVNRIIHLYNQEIDLYVSTRRRLS